jgi:hypothetical protein
MTRIAWCIRTVCTRDPTDWPKDGSERKRVSIDATCCKNAVPANVGELPFHALRCISSEGRLAHYALALLGLTGVGSLRRECNSQHPLAERLASPV